MKTTIILLGIFALGLLFRIVNISPFNFYPDAYQSLIVAHNIQTYHSVIGTLGPTGMFYPDFIEWTRPMYPLLILLFEKLFSNTLFAAHLVAILCGLTSILVSYIFLSTLYKSKIVGLLGAGIIAISFNHVVWGGFILTETTGVFMLLLFLTSLLKNIEKPVSFADSSDLLTGFFFAVSFLARFEYIFLSIPVIFLIIFKNSTFPQKIITIFASFFFVTTIVLSTLFPLRSFFSTILHQGWPLLLVVFTTILFSLMCYLISRSVRTWKISISFGKILLLAEGIGVLFLFIIYPAFRLFFLTNPLITVLALSGIGIMTLDQKNKTMVLFVLLSLAILGGTYYRTNPTMLRYFTHLLPFLLIPAGYTAERIVHVYQTTNLKNRYRKTLLGFFSILVLVQCILTFFGIRFWDNGVWFGKNYEETVAAKIKEKYSLDNALLLASLPEPYYFVTKTSTYSLTDTYPFIYINSTLDNNTIYIIEDQGMRDLFPKFSSLLEKSMLHYKVGLLRVPLLYFRNTSHVLAVDPVVVYKTTVGTLKHVLEAIHKV